MNILLYSDYRYPAKGSSGSERVVERLARGFIKLGHKVYLHCKEGSNTNIEGLQLVFNHIPEDVDVINHHGFCLENQKHYESYNISWCSVLHGGGVEQDPKWLNSISGHPNVICVSKFVSDRLNIPAYVNTCVSEEEFIYKDKKENYLLFLAGFGWGTYKGILTFISLAKKIKKYDFYIAGAGGHTEFTEFIRKTCASEKNIKFIGEINGKVKAEYLANAKALLNPTQLAEAGQSTLPEALISGTPIIGSRNGCLPEIIEKNNVGFCCDTEPQYMKAIMNIDKISAQHCRDVALEKYSDIVCAKKYIEIFEKVIKNGRTY